MALIGSLGTGVSAMKSFVKGLEVVGNNIANVNTTGYKGQRANYGDSFSLTLSQAEPGGGGASNVAPTQIGTGVGVTSMQRNFASGPVSQTGIASDLAILGNGFFQVVDSQGTDFVTRNGAFRLNNDGYLVTQGGLFLQGLNTVEWEAGWDPLSGERPTVSLDETVVGNLRIHNSDDPAERELQAWNIDSQGNVNVFLNDGSNYVAGRVLLQDFNSPDTLTAMGDGMFGGLEAAGPKFTALSNPSERGLGSIQSRALEGSNVDLTEEFANMITAQRAFQAGSRLISVSDEILQEMVNLKR